MDDLSRIPLARPHIPSTVADTLMRILSSGQLTEGPFTRRLEDAFAAFTGAAHAVAVTSCTTGLELLLRALNIGPGDEVIVPDYTYPATAQAVMCAGATAVVVDCNPDTLNIDYDALEAAITQRTKAVMPVSLFGNPLDWERLGALSARHGSFLLEDAACAFGSSYKGRRTGSFGAAAVFSLHPRKSITTGEGGMITTNDHILADRLRSLKRFGLETSQGERETLRFMRLGTNLKMSDLAAAVGLAQMDMVDTLLERRAALAARYRELLTGSVQAGLLRWPECTQGGVHGWQSCCVLVERRDDVMRILRAEGIEVQIGTYALHREPLFQTHHLCRLEGSMPGSLRCYEQTLALPLFHDMTDAQQICVAQRLEALLRKKL